MSGQQDISINKIAIIGSGNMGCQIALQCAAYDFDVNVFSRSIPSKKKAKENIFVNIGMMRMAKKLSSEKIPTVLKSLNFTTDIESAVFDADIIIETIVEDKDEKSKIFRRICSICKDTAILLTNTSTFVPSMFLECVTYPERFAAMHFHSYVWKSTIVDIMPHPLTSENTINIARGLGEKLGQTPIILKKENHNYIFNSILNEVIKSSLALVVDGVVSYKEVDLSWEKILDTSVGPFGLMDLIGLDTVLSIVKYWESVTCDIRLKKYTEFLEPYVEQGKLGIKSGVGFYDY